MKNEATDLPELRDISRNDQVRVLALLVALSHFGLLLVIQLENFFLYIRPSPHADSSLISFLAGLVLGQWENIAAAVLLGVLTLGAAASRPGRWLSFAVVCAVNLYLVVDQVGFKLFFDHFSPSMLEGAQRLGDLRSSITAELDITFYINIVLYLLVSGLLYITFFRGFSLHYSGLDAHLSNLFRSKKAPVFVLILIVIGALFPIRADYANLYHHPFHNLMMAMSDPPRPVAAPSLAAASSPASVPVSLKRDAPNKPLDLQSLRFGKFPPDPQSDERLDAALRASQTQKKPLNIIWIIMESVGSEQLLRTDDRPDPGITPTLAKLAQHAALFDSLYSVFPGTVRSHIDMVTGGRTLTWGSVFKELTYPYDGPTIGRAFSAAGYDTALFSAQKLDFENMNGFYKQAGYDYYYDFGEADPEFQKQNTLQSWGAREGPIMSLAVKWLDKRRDPNRPFFLQYLTVATHHPYDVPFDFRKPVLGTDREDNYLNALSYTDSALGVMLKQLQSRHLLDNTLIVINGDHGEAFGKHHAQDFLHKNFIYEENIKNFLLISNPKLFSDTVFSRRVASIGDIMPTLLSMADIPPADVPGQNLMAKDFKSRLVYFYKNANPAQWGLRDGRWKYIGKQVGDSPELYDLDLDPNEGSNLAQIYPDQVALYDKLVGRWYTKTNHDYVSRLKGFQYPGGKELSEKDLRSAGPKMLTFGYQLPNKDKDADSEFKQEKSFNPYEVVTAWTHWVSFPRDKVIKYVWQSPDDDIHTLDFKLNPEWSTTQVINIAPLPMAEGTWHLTLKDGDKTLISGSFTVDRKTPLHVPREDDANAKEIAMGKYVITDLGKEEFTKTNKMKPGDRVAVWTRWKPLDHDRRIVYRWKAPSGQLFEFYFDVKRGWDQTYVNFSHSSPMEAGHWEVTLWDGERKLTSAKFDVATGNP
jgi:phosphoglycerol transferase MdoB-like AlkP superfamily enzyme